LPDTDGLPSEILLQAGHDVDFGARVSQIIRLGGGRPVLVGQLDGVSVDDFRAAIGERSAGALYVQSHHSRQTGGLALEQLVTLCRARRLPVLVDAAAEEDLERFISAGADLVTYSGGKAIGGPTVGFIVGRRDLIAACEAQNRGIARAMKVGKEQIAGLLTALDRYPAVPGWPRRLAELHGLISAAGGGRVSVEKDRAGRAIERVGLRLATAEAARDLVGALRAGDPAIYTRDHQIGEGLVLFDVREVSDRDVALIAERVKVLLEAMDSRRER
jgi:L-seryl-tRNA(Ser) seleniumtransferase/D-glucosaminate-6-phosphate ammonia-lyase